jgi:hypothetical protein
MRQEEMQRAIAEGHLVIRKMTPEERDESDARRGRGTAASGRDKRHRS